MTVLNIIAASLLAVSATLAFSGNRFIREREIAAGRVTDRIAVRGQKGTTYKIVATFTDKAGRSNVYESSFSSSSPGYKIGDPIRICYKAEDPSDCGVYSFGYRFGPAWIILSIAAALALGGWGFRNGQAVMDSIYLSQTERMELR